MTVAEPGALRTHNCTPAAGVFGVTVHVLEQITYSALSTTVRDVPTVVVGAGIDAAVGASHVRFPLASIAFAYWFAEQSVGFEASAVAVATFPDVVAIVPDVGRVTLVFPVSVRPRLYAPVKVMVLLLLLATPVPPCAGVTTAAVVKRVAFASGPVYVRLVEVGPEIDTFPVVRYESASGPVYVRRVAVGPAKVTFPSGTYELLLIKVYVFLLDAGPATAK
jgi:hypothetical protein